MSLDFYSKLEPIATFSQVADLSCFVEVPDDWVVFVTDVRGSTQAIENGRYKDVNLLGASSIVATLNVCPSRDIPYVFGGDGASILVHQTHAEPVAHALAGLARLSRDVFDLELRVGQVPIEAVRDAGGVVRVARLSCSPDVDLAMFTGGGFAVAEDLVKGAETSETYAVPLTDDIEYPDLEGLQCRWKPISNRNGSMLTLLVVATTGDDATDAATYRDVIETIDGLVRELEPVNPANSGLELANDAASFEGETRLRTGSSGGLKHLAYKAAVTAQVKVATHLINSGIKAGGFDGATYPDSVRANTDFRKFDDCLRMVIDVGDDASAAIHNVLSERQSRGELCYGTHMSPNALMTCIVFDFDSDHVHFIDGDNGGYAMAAKGLKRQLKSR